MIKRIGIVAVLLILVSGFVSCENRSIYGNLVGVIIREGTQVPVPNPVLIIKPGEAISDLADQIVYGDAEGRYSVTLPRDSYNVKIGLKEEGPFYNWPDAVEVLGNQTSIYNFTIPQDFE